MTLQKLTRSRERILLYGQEGTGKTTAWATVAEYLRRSVESRGETPTTPLSKVYVLDTDQTVLRTAESYSDWDRNVVVTDLFGAPWEEYLRTAVKYGAMGNLDDWLVIDTGDSAWDAVQAAFTEKVFGKEIDEWFLAFRRDNPKGGSALAGSYGANWGVINRMYSRYITTILRFKGHIVVCCPADSMASVGRAGESNQDSPEIVNLYGRIGWKPKGQKALGYQMHSVLLMQYDGKEWRMTTVKDRGREGVKGMVVNDFVQDYLVKVAGWENG